MSNQGTPAGWYPDPAGSGRARYWDGGQWQQSPGKGKGIGLKVLIPIGACLLLLVVAGVVGTAISGKATTTTEGASASTQASDMPTTAVPLASTTDTPTTEAPTTETPTTLDARTKQLVTWVAAHSATLTDVATAVSTSSDSFSSDQCRSLSSDASKALAVPGIPDSKLNNYWRLGLQHLSKYALLCLEYLTKPGINGGLVLAELTLAGKYLHASYDGLRAGVAETSTVVPTAPPNEPAWPSVPSPVTTTAPPTTAGPVETVSQKNARQSASDYLETEAFSRKGLIEQLQYEGFSVDDATYGVDALNADWNEQAAKSAAEYLRSSSFSRSGLIEQLVYEGFTQSQAEYGVGTTGL